MAITNREEMLPSFATDIGQHNVWILIDFTWVARYEPFLCAIWKSHDILKELVVFHPIWGFVPLGILSKQFHYPTGFTCFKVVARGFIVPWIRFLFKWQFSFVGLPGAAFVHFATIVCVIFKLLLLFDHRDTKVLVSECVCVLFFDEKSDTFDFKHWICSLSCVRSFTVRFHRLL